MKRWVYGTVFIAGLCTLGAEMSASRLLGNYFGTSNLVWASIIGLIMIYLAAGYFLGGRWADRSPRYVTLYRILAWAGLAVGLVPLLSRPVLRLAADAFDQLSFGVLAGSFLGVLILFIIPISLLGTASPFAIRLLVDDPHTSGSVSGRVYAISTIGSFFGTFLPVLILTPLVGTYRTFLIFAGLLVLTALAGLAKTAGWKPALAYSWMLLVLIILAIFGTPGRDKNTSGLIFEKESAYNYIQVLQFGDTRILRLNEGQGIHSQYHPTELSYNGPWEQVLVAPFFNPPPVDPGQFKRMAIIGLAAGTTARQAAAVFPGIQIDGFEIDPEIVKVGRRFFDMNDPNLTVYVEDGRWGLEHDPNRFQVISVDAYRPPYIPAHMVTREFFQIVYDHLTPDGVMVINVGRAPSDRRLVDAMYRTILTVFPTAFIMDLPDTFNTLIYATRKPVDRSYLQANYEALLPRSDVHPLLPTLIKKTSDNLQPAPADGMIFTDDRAAIEWLTNAMILNFLTSGETENLQ